ncbi:LAFA_0D10000g1_1 [Lachancea sp. 'fantastica']|nr:LAFA_0D10000g1_1 [Lachancea sp. 'fantastica']
MGSLPSDLPKEIWLSLFGYLDSKDLLSLRACSHEFNELVKTQSIWISRCYKRWLEIESEDPLIEQSDEHSRVRPKDDWFYYFRYRNRIDTHVMNTLISLSKGTSRELDNYGDLMEGLSKFGALTVPLLRKIELEGYKEQHSFVVTYLARQLMLMLRHRSFFQLIDDAFATGANEWVHYAEVTAFLPLATMDLAFNRLLPHRNKIFAQVNLQIEQTFEDRSQFMRMPSTLRLDNIMKHLFQALDVARGDRLPQRSRYVLDDFLLLRVYSGEAKGHPMLLLAIIQTISAMYNIETVLCESFLIVRDDRIRNGETYVTISQAGYPRIFTRNNLVESMLRSVPDRQVVLSSVLPKLLQPLKLQDLLRKVFDEFSPQCKKSYWDLASDRRMESLWSLMPFSRVPAQYLDYEYYQMFWQLRMASSQGQKTALLGKSFLRFATSRYPHDRLVLHHLIHIEEGEEEKEFSDTFLNGPQSLHPLFARYSAEKCNQSLVGFIVQEKNRDLVQIVVATKMSPRGSLYVSLLNPFGELMVLSSEDIQVIESDRISPELVSELLHGLSLSELGLFFSHFDEDTHKFVTSPMYAAHIAVE